MKLAKLLRSQLDNTLAHSQIHSHGRPPIYIYTPSNPSPSPQKSINYYYFIIIPTPIAVCAKIKWRKIVEFYFRATVVVAAAATGLFEGI